MADTSYDLCASRGSDDRETCQSDEQSVLHYAGHGVNATHIAGEIICDALRGEIGQFDLFGKIRHFKMPVPRWAGNQMLALGMLYYRLRDLL